jgi:hypothetical protein
MKNSLILGSPNIRKRPLDQSTSGRGSKQLNPVRAPEIGENISINQYLKLERALMQQQQPPSGSKIGVATYNNVVQARRKTSQGTNRR